MMKWTVRGVSVSGTRDYEVVVEADNVGAARRIAREVITDYVRAEFEGGPAGIAYLLNPMSINVQQMSAPQGPQVVPKYMPPVEAS